MTFVRPEVYDDPIDVAAKPSRLNPNDPYGLEFIEVVHQGIWSSTTMTITSYPEQLILSNGGSVGVTEIIPTS